MEINFAQRKVGFYLQDRCPGRAVYWASRYDVIPFQNRDGFMTFYITLDGKRLDVLIDTGAAYSVLSKDAAPRLFGIVPGSSRLQGAGALPGSAAA